MKEMWYIYTKEYYSAMEIEGNNAVCTLWMNLEIIILSEVKSDRERETSYGITYMWNLI